MGCGCAVSTFILDAVSPGFKTASGQNFHKTISAYAARNGYFRLSSTQGEVKAVRWNSDAAPQLHHCWCISDAAPQLHQQWCKLTL